MEDAQAVPALGVRCAPACRFRTDQKAHEHTQGRMECAGKRRECKDVQDLGFLMLLVNAFAVRLCLACSSHDLVCEHERNEQPSRSGAC